MELSSAVVIGIGIGTVFVGLICLVLICYIMSTVVRAFAKNEGVAPAPKATQSAAPVTSTIANKGEFAAAIAAAIAEDLGTDVTGIRIKSVKRL